ncbi:MAG TPA: hypothetical protein PL124_10125 [Candidatus Cloacimonadota bacterium]|nr:hypothetical protein [Candidatus Cloacimonadota bacterium]HPS39757.1 hypothetical protein [Candidatus Cloacimonadota bacterium]
MRKQWTCTICGQCGSSPHARAKEQALYRHRKLNHPEAIDERKNSYKKPQNTLCSDTCVSWTGKKICMVGNVTSPGEERSCHRKDS